jgi:hypothetical protein
MIRFLNLTTRPVRAPPCGSASGTMAPMKPHMRRIALLTVAAACLVVVGLVAFNWTTVRDHAEAWWFVWKRHTQVALPGGSSPALDSSSAFQRLADSHHCPVIFDPTLAVLTTVSNSTSRALGDVLLARLRYQGWRVIEQRFPRRAYVVTCYPDFETPQRLRGGASTTLEPKVTSR